MDIPRNTQHESRDRCVFSIIAAFAMLFGSLALMGYYLNIIPQMTGITFGTFLLYGLTVMVPVLIGGIWLGAMGKRSRKGRHNHAAWGGICFGMALITVGLLLLSFSMELIPIGWKRVFISWQMLLIAIGFMQIFEHRFVSGILIAGVGSFFIIPRMISAYPASWDISGNFTSTYWPMLLIVLGIIIVLAMIIRPKRNRDKGKDRCEGKRRMGQDISSSDDGTIQYSLVFTSAEHVFLEPEFRGGEISVVLAGMELDLRRAQLPEGVTYLKLSTVLGACEIKVPENWYIEIKNESVMGGVSDKRRNIHNSDPTRKLVIIASCVLGGAEIND